MVFLVGSITAKGVYTAGKALLGVEAAEFKLGSLPKTNINRRKSMEREKLVLLAIYFFPSSLSFRLTFTTTSALSWLKILDRLCFVLVN